MHMIRQMGTRQLPYNPTAGIPLQLSKERRFGSAAYDSRESTQRNRQVASACLLQSKGDSYDIGGTWSHTPIGGGDMTTIGQPSCVDWRHGPTEANIRRGNRSIGFALAIEHVWSRGNQLYHSPESLSLQAAQSCIESLQ
jgi:hypothetical protein